MLLSDKRQETADRRQQAFDGRWETGEGRREMGDGGQGTGDREIYDCFYFYFMNVMINALNCVIKNHSSEFLHVAVKARAYAKYLDSQSGVRM